MEVTERLHEIYTHKSIHLSLEHLKTKTVLILLV